jgi:hypothetical protein
MKHINNKMLSKIIKTNKVEDFKNLQRNFRNHFNNQTISFNRKSQPLSFNIKE